MTVNLKPTPCCFKCYWDNYFSGNTAQGTWFVNYDNTELFYICQEIGGLFGIVDMQTNSVIKSGQRLGDLVNYLGLGKYMPVSPDITSTWTYIKQYDKCTCDECNNELHSQN